MQEQSQELTTDQQLQQAIDKYARIVTQNAYERHSGDPARFEQFYEHHVSSAKLTLDERTNILINGAPVDLHVGRTRRNPQTEAEFFGYGITKKADPQAHPARVQDESKQAPATKASEPTVMYVSNAQLNDQRFMRQCGVEILEAIRKDRIKVDDSRAVKSADEIREFLAPKQPEPQTIAPKAEPKAAPKPRTISKDEAMNRNFTRKLDQEWASQGGYLRAVRDGHITIV